MHGSGTILLVGGTGFVGRHLAPALVSAFPRARHVMLARNPDALLPAGWTLELAELLDADSIARAVERLKPDMIIHLAAQSSVGSAGQAAELTWNVNFNGTFNLASAVARYAPESLLFFASTGEVYGRSFALGAASEATPPAPQNAYASSKFAAELMLNDVLPASTRLIIARSLNHTGPGQDERFVLPAFAAQIARIEAGKIEPVMRVGNLAAERDFLHVTEVVEAYLRLLACGDFGNRLLVNVASGKGHSIASLLTLLQTMSRAPFAVEPDPARLRPSDIPRAVGDHSLLTGLTGWTPRLSIDKILLDVLDWQRTRV